MQKGSALRTGGQGAWRCRPTFFSRMSRFCLQPSLRPDRTAFFEPPFRLNCEGTASITSHLLGMALPADFFQPDEQVRATFSGHVFKTTCRALFEPLWRALVEHFWSIVSSHFFEYCFESLFGGGMALPADFFQPDEQVRATFRATFEGIFGALFEHCF